MLKARYNSINNGSLSARCVHWFIAIHHQISGKAYFC